MTVQLDSLLLIFLQQIKKNLIFESTRKKQQECRKRPCGREAKAAGSHTPQPFHKTTFLQPLSVCSSLSPSHTVTQLEEEKETHRIQLLLSLSTDHAAESICPLKRGETHRTLLLLLPGVHRFHRRFGCGGGRASQQVLVFFLGSLVLSFRFSFLPSAISGACFLPGCSWSRARSRWSWLLGSTNWFLSFPPLLIIPF
jgi:hypothetical protein